MPNRITRLASSRLVVVACDAEDVDGAAVKPRPSPRPRPRTTSDPSNSLLFASSLPTTPTVTRCSRHCSLGSPSDLHGAGRPAHSTAPCLCPVRRQAAPPQYGWAPAGAVHAGVALLPAGRLRPVFGGRLTRRAPWLPLLAMTGGLLCLASVVQFEPLLVRGSHGAFRGGGMWDTNECAKYRRDSYVARKRTRWPGRRGTRKG
jgi:hypothetical protein